MSRCCPGPGCCPRGTSATLLLFFLLFSFFRSKRALVDWYAFKPRLGLVLASFFVLPDCWCLCFLCLCLCRCCWCCCCWLWPALQRNAKAKVKSALWLRARNVLLIFTGDLEGKSTCGLRAHARNVSLISATFCDWQGSVASGVILKAPCKKQCSWCDFSGVMWLISVFHGAYHTRCAFRADRMGTIGPRALRRGEFRASFQFFSYVSCSKKSWHVLTHFETTWNVSNNAFKMGSTEFYYRLNSPCSMWKRMCLTYSYLFYSEFFPSLHNSSSNQGENSACSTNRSIKMYKTYSM